MHKIRGAEYKVLERPLLKWPAESELGGKDTEPGGGDSLGTAHVRVLMASTRTRRVGELKLSQPR